MEPTVYTKHFKGVEKHVTDLSVPRNIEPE